MADLIENKIVHFCDGAHENELRSYIQQGTGAGKKLLIIGEAPAPRGWRLSGRAFYTPEGKLLPTGKRLNDLLSPYGLTVETTSFTELVKCFIGSERSLLYSCAKKSWPVFLDQVQDSNASLLLILGKKTHETFEKLVDRKIDIGVIKQITIAGSKVAYLGIYHPSPISPTSQKRNNEIFIINSRRLNELLN